MDEWARIRSGISSAEQALVENAARLREQLQSDPNCNADLIKEALEFIEAVLKTIAESRSS